MKSYSNYSLLAHNTFGISAKANRFIEYDTVGELMDVLRSEAHRYSRILHIGSGSNLLFTSDFDGLVLYSQIKFIYYTDCGNGVFIARVGSGVVWDDFCADVAHRGLWGVENLSFIPGQVGASAVQNIGAYGVEVADVIERVEVIDRVDCSSLVIDARDCDYGYRYSRFKTEWRERFIVTAVHFRLTSFPTPKLGYAGLNDLKNNSELLSPQIIRDKVTQIRKDKLPDPAEIGSAGSFFKNPVVDVAVYNALTADFDVVPHFALPDGKVKIPAAWLIERCGLKGKTVGGAQVYCKQPLVIVNTGGASADDVVRLADLVKNSVAERFGICIEPEVNYI